MNFYLIWYSHLSLVITYIGTEPTKKFLQLSKYKREVYFNRRINW